MEHGKQVMSEIQKIVVERECDLWTEQSRVCNSCMARLPIKDYRHRVFLTIYGPVKVRPPRLKDCQRCNPWSHFTYSPLAYLSPDRATPELMEISAKLGALLPYRQASDVLNTFLPAQKESGFTTASEGASLSFASVEAEPLNHAKLVFERRAARLAAEAADRV